MQATSRSPLSRYGAAVLSIALATWVRMLLDPLLGDRMLFPTFLVAVLFSAWCGGFLPSLLAVVLGFVSAVYFFVPPRYSFAVHGPENQAGLALYLFVGIVTAVLSEWLRAEAQAERLKMTLTDLGDAAIATDSNGRITFLNGVAQSLTGWTPEEAAGQPLENVFHVVNERIWQSLDDRTERGLSGGGFAGLANHTVLIARDGTERLIEESAAPIRDADGRFLGVVFIFGVLQRQRVDLAALMADAVQTSRPLVLARQQELTVSLPPKPLWLEADPARLTGVVSNLLANAASYTPEGGRIGVTGEQQDSEVVLRIRDNGMGIAAEMLPHVFDLVAQAESRVAYSEAGLGIGLTAVKSLVEMHGGSIQALSEGPDNGSEFVVRLPALPAPPARPRLPAADSGSDVRTSMTPATTTIWSASR